MVNTLYEPTSTQTLAAVGRQPTTPLTATRTGGLCGASWCHHPASLEVAPGDRAAEQPAAGCGDARLSTPRI